MRRYSNVSKDRQALAIYGSNALAGILSHEHVGSSPGAVLYGGLNIIKRFGVDGIVLRGIEAVGAIYFTCAAVSNALAGVHGNMTRLADAVFDASMAYQLIVNEEAFRNFSSDFRRVSRSLERTVSKNRKG